MTAVKFLLAGGAAVAALATAAPAAAQYYPGYGGPGQVINQVFGGGYNGYGYGVNQQAVVNQCAAAVQQRLSGGYGYNPYGYNNNAYGGGRVLGISRVEPRSNGGLTVRGVASSGRYGNQPDLTFKCKVDYRGYVSDVDVDPAQGAYGYNYTPYNQGYGYSPYGNDYVYSQYGYRRY